MDDQIETTNLRQSKLLLVDTSFIDLLPHLDAVSFARALDRCLIVLQMHQSRCEFSPIGDTSKENLRSLMISFLISLVARCFNIRYITRMQEVFEVAQFVQTGVAESQCCVDRRLSLSLSGHPQILDEFFIFASMSRALNDFEMVTGILGPNVRLD